MWWLRILRTISSSFIQTTQLSNMTWALFLSANEDSVTDDHLNEIDDYELASRAGPHARTCFLSHRIGRIVNALVCAAGAVNSRAQMLRSVHVLSEILTDLDFKLLQKAVRGYTACLLQQPQNVSDHNSFPSRTVLRDSMGPLFLQPLANIAVNRVSDKQLSAIAADSLAILLGCSSLDQYVDDNIPKQVCDQADEQTKRLIAMLITEIVLTSSPAALNALAKLLRRDKARLIFCEKDGVSTLASTLHTKPGKSFTAIGEVVANMESEDNPVYASYHAVFAVWMLSFAKTPQVLDKFLENVCASRLVFVLARLLNHASGQRLKITRVTLASLHNMAVGHSMRHQKIRRDLVSADVPQILRRIMRMTAGPGSLIGKDDDAMLDANALCDVLAQEKASMSTLDAYTSEVRAGALHWSPIHKDDVFWQRHASNLIEKHPELLLSLARIVADNNIADEVKLLACHDLSQIIRYGPTGRHAVASINGMKRNLMELMIVGRTVELRQKALTCVQLLLLPNCQSIDRR